ncbi:N-acetylmuramic acid 6-phosphate etherase [Mycobacterium kyorinense]|uniref:N-acetylmuramic acid 6-phosphate etherase n=1 Tax=Mycobacterium kyorinense TaxID=487514 RepID=A0A1A2ZI65_9MYCO|nr:N-acetylmuramic acid 6-phosphate etherase [Mycobacterium kyorinense]OBI49950.1 N-acetylmuramic acid 6-phosphate etherase [Mycobacterium kyorinense]
MPVFTVDAPNGATRNAKHTMLKEITDALDEAYHFPDTRGWLREYSAENVSQDGRVQAEPVRPVVSLEAPELASLDAKRKLVQKIETAVGSAYAGIANVEEVLVLINHYPLQDVGWRGSLQSDKPEIVAALAELNR